MPKSSKKCRTLNPNNLNNKRIELQKTRTDIQDLEQTQLNSLLNDTTHFFKNILDFTPYPYQLELAELFEKNQFIAVRWPRQTGKSFTVSALLLKYAYEHPNSTIAIVGPSWRQTKLNLRRISNFTKKLPQQNIHTQKTRITLPNNSVIEAFPNNPETIRGPTFQAIWIEEANFIANDEELYDAILFTLGTTNGKLIATSTPWNTDSLFYKMCNHKDYQDFARSHIQWNNATEPNGPLKTAIVEKIKRQFGDDPQRWRREMEAEWAEDQDTWLPQSLIVNCIGTTKNCGQDLQEHNPDTKLEGNFFAGLDLAQTKDYSVLTIIEKLNDKLLLRHLKIFQQPTLYTNVLGYLKTLQDRWGGLQKIRIDNTREGPSIIADMTNAGIDNAEGVTFSIPRKSEMASLLKQRMLNNQFFYPLIHWERPYRGDICTELNIERYNLRKDATIGYSHPSGTHDDVFWSIALAIFATMQMEPEPFLTIIPR